MHAFIQYPKRPLEATTGATKYKVPFNTVVIESVSCPLENFPLTQLITEKNHDFCKLKVIWIKKDIIRLVMEVKEGSILSLKNFAFRAPMSTGLQ